MYVDVTFVMIIFKYIFSFSLYSRYIVLTDKKIIIHYHFLSKCN